MSRTLILLQFEVGHRYFADGRARGLRFEAAGDTARRMRRAGVLERQDGASLWLLGPAGASQTLTEDNPEPLTWWVRATDPDFFLYTDDPARRPDELLLVAPATSAAEPAPAAVQTPEAPAAPNMPNTPNTPEVQVMKIWRGPANDTRPPPDGHYPLSGEAAWRPPFAVLQVPPSALQQPEPPSHLRWMLAPRHLVWKYCLFGDWSEDALDIVDAAGDVSFAAPVAEHGADGRPLLALRSSAPLALAERSDTRLQLRCRQSGVPKVLVKRLPVPGPQHLAREEIDGAATLVSEIHVHR